VSIDLIVRSRENVLLGYRQNEPARDTWFVPGGAVWKDESLDEAFSRIVQAELGLTRVRADSKFRGVYEHFYGENFMSAPAVTTHYVVLAHELHLDASHLALPMSQHSTWKWFSKVDLLGSDAVHDHVKAYFGD
jgi:colanic acid biosynthesis protein WcaH